MYRSQMIGPRYAGWAHLAFTSLGALAVIALAVAGLHRITAAEWLVVPGTFLVANLIEYLGHRGPMHHPRRGLGILYQRHTRQHHRFYTHEAMRCESPRDFHIILFPPAMLLFFLGGIAVPLGLLVRWLATTNAGLLFAATAMAYFLTYEWLHFCYHQPPASRLGRLPFMAVLRRHHTVHHDQALMGRYNFNITFPICDRLFGTNFGTCPDD